MSLSDGGTALNGGEARQQDMVTKNCSYTPYHVTKMKTKQKQQIDLPKHQSLLPGNLGLRVMWYICSLNV